MRSGTRKRGRSTFRLRKRSSADDAGRDDLDHRAFIGARAGVDEQAAVGDGESDHEDIGRIDDAPHLIEIDAEVGFHVNHCRKGRRGGQAQHRVLRRVTRS